jgi:hypothetical protein
MRIKMNASCSNIEAFSLHIRAKAISDYVTDLSFTPRPRVSITKQQHPDSSQHS